MDYWEEYKYDSAGNRTKETFYNADGSVNYRVEYEYEDGKNTKRTVYNADGIINCREEYDSAGNMTKATWYDADGNVIGTN